MTRAQAAEYLGVHERTISRYMARGKLRYTRDARTGRVLVHVPERGVQDGSPRVVVTDG